MSVEESLEYIREQLEAHGGLVHASNIIGKCKKESGRKLAALQSLAVEYAEYLRKNLALEGYSRAIITERVAALNDYYAFYDHNSAYDFGTLFKSQGKLRPTILEEFIYLLFKDYFEDLRNSLDDCCDAYDIGATKAYTNLYFSPMDFRRFASDVSIKINEKDQDFAIYRKVGLKVDGIASERSLYKANVPVLAVEAKTYLDKTMLEGVIATAEKLKKGNPYARFAVVAETYEVDTAVDPSYSEIDQIYVFRKGQRRGNTARSIQPDVVVSLFDEAKQHLEGIWSDVESKLHNTGKII